MNSVTLIGVVAARLGASTFVLAVDRADAGPVDLVPVAWAGAATAGDRLAVEGSLRVRGGKVEVAAEAIHPLPEHMATI